MVLETLIKRFKAQKIDFAIIGGIAVGAAGYSRATQDLDFIALLTDADRIDKIMADLDYKPLQITEEFGLYGSDIEIFGRVDFLFAHREYSFKMLKRAKEMPILNGAMRVKVLDPEDIIGLKVQSIVNNPERIGKDMSDIENLMIINKKNLDKERIREYFALFGKENELIKIQQRIKNA